VRSQGRDRRLQLVRDVRDEVPTEPLEALELRAHAVERFGEGPDLVARDRLHALGVVASRHPPRRVRHVAERLRHPPREPSNQQQRDAGGDRSAEQELPPIAAEEPHGGAGRRDRPSAGNRPERVDHPGTVVRRHRDVLVTAGDARVHAGGEGGTHEGRGKLRRTARSDDEHAFRQRRRAPVGHGVRDREELQRLGIARGVAERVAEEHVHHEDRHRDGEDDREAELRPDRRHAVERPAAHAVASRNA